MEERLNKINQISMHFFAMNETQVDDGLPFRNIVCEKNELQ